MYKYLVRQSLQDYLRYLHNKLEIFPVLGFELEFYFKNLSNAEILKVVEDLSLNFNLLSFQGFSIVKEQSDCQYELKTPYNTDFITILDQLVTIKLMLIEKSQEFSGEILFDAKPFLDRSGSAFHVHINLLNSDGNNLFSGQHKDYLLYSVGGLCKSVKRDMIFFAPYAESYLRYKYYDLFTPTTISWGDNNRTTAIRIPCVVDKIKNRRIEHRISGADCDYYKVVLLILQSIIMGIESKIIPLPKVYGVAHDAQYCLERLPLSLEEASTYSK